MKSVIAILTSFLLIVVACGSDGSTDVAAGGTDEPADELPVNDGDEPADPGEPVAEPGDDDAEPGTPQPLPDEPLGGGPYPIADLTITYEHPDVGVVEYQIVCLGDTATLIGDIEGVRDQSACLALARSDVQIRLDLGDSGYQVCTEIYGGPETAKIEGTIDAKRVSTSVDRSNGCGINDWDNVLADLLPPPRPFS